MCYCEFTKHLAKYQGTREPERVSFRVALRYWVKRLLGRGGA